MSRLFKSLILSAVTATLVCAAPVPSQDPCAVLSHLQPNATTVQHVSDCYKSIPFNPSEAKTTLDALHTLYNDFFIFRDAALTPDLALPFTSPPVDVVAGIERIQKTKYSTDFDFHADLTWLAKSLNDAHVTYFPTCYNAFQFQQPLLLYAPVIDGRQSIRIYKDLKGKIQEDCEVLEINGENAVSYLQAWADKNTGLSKDAGVRLNNVLVSQNYFSKTKTWGPIAGAFSERTGLPDAEYIDYRIQCKGQDAQDIRGSWVVADSPEPGTFTDRASYVKNVCLAPTTDSGKTSVKEDVGPRVEAPMIVSDMITRSRLENNLQEFALKQENMLRKRGVGEPSSPPQDYQDAIFVDGDVTAVYQLKSKPHVGILVVPTMTVNPSQEILAIQARLTMLADRGVTNIIIDTSGNGGGDVSFSSLLVSIFFPVADKRTNAHLARFRDTPAAAALGGADLANTTVTTYFEPGTLANKTTGQPIATNFFLDPVTIRVNGREAEYTDEFYMDYQPILDKTKTHPWTGDASKIAILTDGQCGSACGMTSELFTNKHGVKAVAVGGYSGKALSMFSFAGASVIGQDAIVDTFEQLGVPSTMARLPYRNTVNIGVIEIYSGTDTIPLEYNPQRYIAAHRLDYTPRTARNHDLLWGATAEVAWA
ncbi:hypothetical protein B0O80DRAFT_497239 [Mortierella sp. GBAus27b]|nr:hypothetical protein BGX31_000183 [Mortierella sp. GBA43]KAI8356543.1 hypothetical protein B0O80DRAFT_497239 [Mortierella sp. GBAus27b]